MSRPLTKAIAFGAAIFASASIVTSGVAAFVISLAGARAVDGEVHVAIVNDVNVRFEDLAFDGSDDLGAKICFDAEKDDQYGRFFYIDDDHHTYEHLKVTLTGKVLPVRYVKDVTLQLFVSTEYNEEVNPILDAIELGYLELATWAPENTAPSQLAAYDYLDHAVVIPLGDTDPEDDSKPFAITFGFNWGRKFAYMNPAHYFDDDAAGGGPAYYSDDQVFDEMAKFVRCLHYGKEYVDLEKPLPEGYEKNDSSPISFTVQLRTVMRD